MAAAPRIPLAPPASERWIKFLDGLYEEPYAKQVQKEACETMQCEGDGPCATSNLAERHAEKEVHAVLACEILSTCESEEKDEPAPNHKIETPERSALLTLAGVPSEGGRGLVAE